MNATSFKIDATPTCTECNGTGRAYLFDGPTYAQFRRCEPCNGTGDAAPDEPLCPYCEAPIDETGFCGACREQVAA